ncbi:MAG: hypothetical protein ITG02_01070 [Patulibacter sp.]|nr:hypothetical protein [Patulibacter sp.]
MTARRLTASSLDSVEAQCQGCTWTARSRNAQGIAAQHHDRTGHPVRVVTTRAVTYGDITAAPHGQESLLDQMESTT